MFSSVESLHNTLQPLFKGQAYLIQKGIHLLRHQGRPFDLRVLTQKSPAGQWVSTGIIGRVAAKNKIITNHHSGGVVHHYKPLMLEHMTDTEAENIRRELYVLGVNVAAQLQKSYPHLKEIGLDVAIDNRWNIWILEVNTKPALFPFKKFFKDPSVYQKVKKYANAYGRKLSSKKKAN
ncbi:YheC/YheD family protein [Paenibacillus sp. JCM 10914]|uniref:YheC/YheD family protein n=1 Tax=Paenibacillus sp. JCM 10914 TaxID=1236974 RepID=UPI001E3C655F|nr:YheC/YheD family protein [Paenibacillus sp. JCM 10914]